MTLEPSEFADGLLMGYRRKKRTFEGFTLFGRKDGGAICCNGYRGWVYNKDSDFFCNISLLVTVKPPRPLSPLPSVPHLGKLIRKSRSSLPWRWREVQSMRVTSSRPSRSPQLPSPVAPNHNKSQECLFSLLSQATFRTPCHPASSP